MTDVEVGQASDVGLVREGNEDNILVHAPLDEALMRAKGRLFLLADGMGAHAAGELASRLAVEILAAEYYGDNGPSPEKALENGVHKANLHIYQLGHGSKNGHGPMGTTLTAVAVNGRYAHIAHVGDSRAYLLRNDGVAQLTTDHSMVGEMVRMRMITVEQARVHPDRNALSRCIGMTPLLKVDMIRQELHPGDTLVLCSDGLWSLVRESEIGAVAAEHPPQAACDRLVELAKSYGGDDNISAIVVRVQAIAANAPMLPTKRRLLSWLKT
ncbi:MAG: PP2C family serine/threonine-protein phosphatase [Anaerolineae bacterium]